MASAVDTLKLQLGEEADNIKLNKVFYAPKEEDAVVIKLICNTGKKDFEFLF